MAIAAIAAMAATAAIGEDDGRRLTVMIPNPDDDDYVI
jgi:hypothetical protein